MSEKSSSERLKEILGFDAGKSPSVTGEMFQELIAEQREEELKAAKEKVSGLLRKAMDLRKEKVKLDRQYTSQSAKFEKELGKLVKQLDQAIKTAGGEAPIIIEESEVEETETES